MLGAFGGINEYCPVKMSEEQVLRKPVLEWIHDQRRVVARVLAGWSSGIMKSIGVRYKIQHRTVSWRLMIEDTWACHVLRHTLSLSLSVHVITKLLCF